MPRDWHERVLDILEAIELAQQFVRDMTFEEFQSDIKTIRAVAYQIALLGEAANHIPPQVQALRPDLPWPQMRGIRNIAIHEYFRLDIPTLWQTVIHDLPSLVGPLRQMLDESQEGQA